MSSLAYALVMSAVWNRFCARLHAVLTECAEWSRSWIHTCQMLGWIRTDFSEAAAEISDSPTCTRCPKLSEEIQVLQRRMQQGRYYARRQLAIKLERLRWKMRQQQRAFQQERSNATTKFHNPQDRRYAVANVSGSGGLELAFRLCAS